MNTLQKKRNLKQSILMSTGEDIKKCYVCGKCTAGCPMTAFMTLPPHQMMQLLQLEDNQSLYLVFSASTIWSCVSCETCSARCPNEIRLSRIMDELRKIALNINHIPKHIKNIVSFHQAFLDSIHFFGRVPEFFLTINYKMRSLTPFQDITLAPKMKYKGKLHLRPRRIRGIDEIKNIFKKSEETIKTKKE